MSTSTIPQIPTIDIEHGGTNATTAAAARTNLDVYSKSETDSAISQSTASIINGIDLGSFDSMDALKTALCDFAASMGGFKTVNFRFYPNFSDSTAGFYQTGYGERMGTIYIRTSDRFAAIIVFFDGTITRMANKAGTWSIGKIALQ